MSRRAPRYPLVFLGAMTLFTCLGPFGIGYALRGGASPSWPPDRAVEWVVLIGVSGTVFALMMGCLSLALVNHQAIARGSGPQADRGERRP